MADAVDTNSKCYISCHHGTGDADFPSGLRMLIRYRKNRPQLSERMLFTPISNANIKMAVAVIISAYPVVVILNRFSMFFVKTR